MVGKPTKKKLLKLICDLEQNPNDRIRIFGDAGIATLGAGLGAAAAGTVAAAAGATSIFGVTTIAGWFGVTAVAATPVGWIIGCAAVAGAGAYGVSRLIRGGGLSEGRTIQLLQMYKHELQTIEAKERASCVTDVDKTKLIISMRELIEKDVLKPELAKRLIEQVENGHLPISTAINQIHTILASTVEK